MLPSRFLSSMRIQRYSSRLWTARSVEFAHRHVPLVVALGEDGMSSDSSDHGASTTVYHIHPPRIPRSREVSDVLYWLDEVSCHVQNGFSDRPVNQLPPSDRRAYGR